MFGRSSHEALYQGVAPLGRVRTTALKDQSWAEQYFHCLPRWKKVVRAEEGAETVGTSLVDFSLISDHFLSHGLQRFLSLSGSEVWRRPWSRLMLQGQSVR